MLCEKDQDVTSLCKFSMILMGSPVIHINKKNELSEGKPNHIDIKWLLPNSWAKMNFKAQYFKTHEIKKFIIHL